MTSQWSILDVTCAIYTAAAVNMKPYTRLNIQWDSHNFICSMTNQIMTCVYLFVFLFVRFVDVHKAQMPTNWKRAELYLRVLRFFVKLCSFCRLQYSTTFCFIVCLSHSHFNKEQNRTNYMLYPACITDSTMFRKFMSFNAIQYTHTFIIFFRFKATTTDSISVSETTTSPTTTPTTTPTPPSYRLCYGCGDSSGKDGQNDCQVNTYEMSIEAGHTLGQLGVTDSSDWDQELSSIDYVQNCTRYGPSYKYCMIETVETQGNITINVL